MASRLRFLFALLLLLVAIILLAWGIWPAGRNEQTLTLPPEKIQVVQAASPLLLRLRTPHFARAGDILSVQLQCIPQGAWNKENTTMSILARARLEMHGVEVRPASAISQPLLDDSIFFYWRLSERKAGKYQGRLWFHLETISSGDEYSNSEQTLAAMPVEVETRALLGLSGAAARGTGAVAAFIATLFFVLPFLSTKSPRATNNASTKSP